MSGQARRTRSSGNDFRSVRCSLRETEFDFGGFVVLGSLFLVGVFSVVGVVRGAAICGEFCDLAAPSDSI